jgi:hypothetical protein
LSKIDPFTERRLLKFITDFRSHSGTLPTLKDLDDNGFGKETVDAAIKQKLIEMLYVTLTNGTVVKGYKISIPS